MTMDLDPEETAALDSVAGGADEAARASPSVAP